jgi:hypothetical protein
LDSFDNRLGSHGDRLVLPDDRFGSPADRLDSPDHRLDSATIVGYARRDPHRDRSVTQSRCQKPAPERPVESEARFDNFLGKERNSEKSLGNPAEF